MTLISTNPPALRPGLPGAAVARIDPRLRVCVALVFAVLMSQVDGFGALGLGLAAGLGLLLASGQPIGPVLRRMAAMDGFILFMLVLLPFTTPGVPLFSVWGHGASLEGLRDACDILLTANAVVLMVLVLPGTLEPVTLGHALGRLGVPLSLVNLLLFTVRYITVLEGEYQRMRQAMRARAFAARSDLHTLTSLGYLVGMMLVRAQERSERVLQAMKCRGFNGALPLIDAMRWRGADTLWALGFAGLLGAVIALEIAHVPGA
ncbi:cobalt ECF transporter T component CbiQ [Phaeovulum vinaykumarii]|uniref:Cobalt/nickel transport system permease protein n=1 Tax=Phaeovulum vinaykumarii TaxID=407234 RepID=A0A1N7MID2_9RHOB|nr:cobalt ECF transporter T component CbiQ [Phaeovulum vinaykumarii]SIS85885.1 cobalt/nickel transport system permease protein [Phaeovulum vinaykumarii]SOC12411.1 cobalt/nickel transport system permease protein [Phaeovulum vinaykumarii]